MNRRSTRLVALLLSLAGASAGWWWYQAQAQRTTTSAETLAKASGAEAAHGASQAASAALSAASQAEWAVKADPLPVTGWEPVSGEHDPCARDLATAPAGAASGVLNGKVSPQALAQLVQALGASTEPVAQALAAWWPSISASQQAALRLNEQTAACDDKLPCERKAFGQFVSERAAAREPGANAVARLAVDTGTPAVYAMAVEACKEHPWGQGRPAPAQCQLISLERWAQLDADNAVPWLHLADQALQRQDEAGVAEALHRASLARSNRAVGSELIRYAQPALATLPELDRLGLAWQLVTGVQASWSLPGYGTVINFCSTDALNDPNRRPTCEGLATLLIERSPLMIEHNIGIRLAERLGWPAARLDALKQERDALYAAFQDTLAGDAQAPPCAASRHALHVSTLMATLGELGLARALVARSGLTIEAYARREAERTRQRVRAAEAASAASAATAAPGASTPVAQAGSR